MNYKHTIGCFIIHGTHVTANSSTYNDIVSFFNSDFKIKEVNLMTLVDRDPKGPFLKGTTSRYRRGHFSIPWIALIYP